MCADSFHHINKECAGYKMHSRIDPPSAATLHHSVPCVHPKKRLMRCTPVGLRRMGYDHFARTDIGLLVPASMTGG